jgi:hypothetical protein
MRYSSTLLLLLSALLIGATAEAQVAVVNPRLVDLVDREKLKNILLGRVSAWADGSQITLVLSSDPVSRAAIEELTGRDLDRLMRGWKRIMFAGNGAMPVVVDSSAGALKEVGQHLGAIAIVGLLEAQVGEQAKVALPLHGKPPSSP